MKWDEWRNHPARRENLYVEWFEDLKGDQASNWQQTAETLKLEFPRKRFKIPHIIKKLEDYVNNFPVPKFAWNSEFEPGDDSSSWEPPSELKWNPSDSTVIVGIIDTDIALGHRSTRLPGSGNTRILASWQQSAVPPGEYNTKGKARMKKNNLPFGRELLADEIDDLLEEHSIGGRANGWLDEEAFNRAAGLVDFRNIYGHRGLARRAAHGTHVLDRAAGYDPSAIGYDPSKDDHRAEEVRIIVVNLPPREVVGLSGSFLEVYIAMGIARIIEVAKGFDPNAPVIVNLSFGKQAGPRDGSGLIARLIETINKGRELENGDHQPGRNTSGRHRYIDKGTVYLTIPAGNDNLERGNAVAKLHKLGDPKNRMILPWRILPEDQSSNYVEIWSDKFDADDIIDQKIPLKISIKLPNGLSWGASLDKSWQDLHENLRGDDSEDVDNVFRKKIEDIARVYCKLVKVKIAPEGARQEYRIHYFICSAPTLVQHPHSATAPAGLWNIELENMTGKELSVFANVQTDQSVMPDGVTGLRSYFDDVRYRRFDETTGRRTDTYPYPGNEEPIREREGSARHGTLNALSINKDYSILTAGYRATDGAPAHYSGTGRSPSLKDDESPFPDAPTLALVTDDGPAHPGVLSAGSRDGSAVAMQGTSTAAPQITREIAERIAGGETNFNPTTWIEEQAKPGGGGEIEENEKKFPDEAHQKKAGKGRWPQSHYRGLNRLGLEKDD